MRHAFLCLVVPGILAACAAPDRNEHAGAIEFDPDDVRAHVEFLADDFLEGRGTGTRGHEIAARYVASEFRGAGLEPGTAGSFFDAVTLRLVTVDAQRSTAALVRDGRAEALAIFDGYFPSGHPRETETSVEAPLVFVGYGITAPAFEYDDYDGVDVAGKIAVVLYGSPPSIEGDAGAHYSSPQPKAQRAGDLGAVGILVIPTDALLRLAPWEMLARFNSQPTLRVLDASGEPVGGSPNIREGGMLNPALAARLFADAPSSWEEVKQAAAGGRPGSFDLGLSLRLRTFTRHDDITSPNVVGVLRGTDPTLRDEYVVLTAHLDHDGIGPAQQGDSIYNGAVDNAAGIAALIEVARAFERVGPARRSVMFVATTAEEKGLLGAESFAANPPVPVEAIVANVNMDGNHMLVPSADILALGSEHSSLDAVVARSAASAGLEVGIDPMPEQNFFVRSDHYPFVKQGIPAVFLIGGFTSSDPAINGLEVVQQWLGTVYHTPADDASQTLHYEAGADYARTAFLIVHEIANSDERPAWKPGFFGETFGRR